MIASPVSFWTAAQAALAFRYLGSRACRAKQGRASVAAWPSGHKGIQSLGTPTNDVLNTGPAKLGSATTWARASVSGSARVMFVDPVVALYPSNAALQFDSGMPEEPSRSNP